MTKIKTMTEILESGLRLRLRLGAHNAELMGQTLAPSRINISNTAKDRLRLQARKANLLKTF